jgi:prophage regulatory protein
MSEAFGTSLLLENEMNRGAPKTSGGDELIGRQLDVSSQTTIRLMRLPEVCRATGLCRAMIYRLQSEQRFPRSVKITEHAVGWIEHEIQRWLTERASVGR